MPYVGVLIALGRHDPEHPDVEPPPLIALDRTHVDDAEPHPEEENVVIGALEAAGPDWADELYWLTHTAAALNGIDKHNLCCAGEWMEATVHFNTATWRFRVTADSDLVERPGFIPHLIEAFCLPRDPAFVDVVVRPIVISTLNAPDTTDQFTYRYDWASDKVVVSSRFAEAADAPAADAVVSAEEDLAPA